MVDVPTAKITAMEKRKFVNGRQRFTADMANSPTPLETKMPSTVLYRENTNSERMVGTTNREKSRFRELLSREDIVSKSFLLPVGLHPAGANCMFLLYRESSPLSKQIVAR
jgi:hypothetical protein